MELQCNFCNGKFKSVSSLNYHKKNNKKCLQVQLKLNCSVTSDLKECNYCLHKFTKWSLSRHLIVCKSKKKIDERIVKEHNDNVEEKYIQLKLENEQMKEKIYITELQEKIIKYEAEINILKNDREVLNDIAKQPRSTNTNNTNNYNLSVFQTDIIAEKFKNQIENASPRDFYEGQKSVARMTVPCLINDNGDNMYQCSDYSRTIFLLKNDDGKLIRDAEAKKLVSVIKPHAVSKCKELIQMDSQQKNKVLRLKQIYRELKNEEERRKSLIDHIRGYDKNSSEYEHYFNILNKLDCKIEMYLEERNKLENEGVRKTDSDDIDEKLSYGYFDIERMDEDSKEYSNELRKFYYN